MGETCIGMVIAVTSNENERAQKLKTPRCHLREHFVTPLISENWTRTPRRRVQRTDVGECCVLWRELLARFFYEDDRECDNEVFV
jgi:hypothetical protein